MMEKKKRQRTIKYQTIHKNSRHKNFVWHFKYAVDDCMKFHDNKLLFFNTPRSRRNIFPAVVNFDTKDSTEISSENSGRRSIKSLEKGVADLELD